MERVPVSSGSVGHGELDDADVVIGVATAAGAACGLGPVLGFKGGQLRADLMR
jgi:hypothetical protein